MELIKGDTFQNVHMPNHRFEVLSIIPHANKVKISISHIDPDRQSWSEDWNLEHTLWGFDKMEYHSLNA